MSIEDALKGPDPEPQREELTAAEIQEIRALYASGTYRQVDLAEEFGVGQPYISRVVNRKRRKGVE